MMYDQFFLSLYLFFFFFTSRRRHTSCSRDWISDVCSSDLVVASCLAVHETISLQNSSVRSATASSEKSRIARALPACASGRRWSAAARRRSAAESASGSSPGTTTPASPRSEEHTSELQSRLHLVCR